MLVDILYWISLISALVCIITLLLLNAAPRKVLAVPELAGRVHNPFPPRHMLSAYGKRLRATVLSSGAVAFLGVVALAVVRV